MGQRVRFASVLAWSGPIACCQSHNSLSERSTSVEHVNQLTELSAAFRSAEREGTCGALGHLFSFEEPVTKHETYLDDDTDSDDLRGTTANLSSHGRRSPHEARPDLARESKGAVMYVGDPAQLAR